MRKTLNRLLVWATIIIFLLLIPLTLMQFTYEVNWDIFDFVLMGGALSIVAALYEFIARKSKKAVYRFAFAVGLLGAFLLFWVNGAVGIIGSENHPANLLYSGVFLIGLIGALLARFKPKGMFYTMITATFVQLLIPIVALILWPPSTTLWTPGVYEIFTLNAFFAVLFVISALLFKQTKQLKK